MTEVVLQSPRAGKFTIFKNIMTKIMMGFTIILISFLIIAAVLNLRLGVEGQEVSCLPFTYGIERFHNVTEFKRGDILMFATTYNEMGDKFKGRMIAKMVAAIPGDEVLVKDGYISINGKVWGDLGNVEKVAEYMHRDVHSFDRKEIVPPGMLLMLGTLPRSFDGRYWGFLHQSSILGTVYPIY